MNQKYRNIKQRLFPHGGVARRCHIPDYVASSRLALRKNPSILFAPLFLIYDTSVQNWTKDQERKLNYFCIKYFFVLNMLAIAPLIKRQLEIRRVCVAAFALTAASMTSLPEQGGVGFPQIKQEGTSLLDAASRLALCILAQEANHPTLGKRSSAALIASSG
ncbi:MAG: hypothetical protein Q8L71_05025 [Thiobacillus sp.]|nr:hypothetical protein [Thiobacillus sp.]